MKNFYSDFLLIYCASENADKTMRDIWWICMYNYLPSTVQGGGFSKLYCCLRVPLCRLIYYIWDGIWWNLLDVLKVRSNGFYYFCRIWSNGFYCFRFVLVKWWCHYDVFSFLSYFYVQLKADQCLHLIFTILTHPNSWG